MRLMLGGTVPDLLVDLLVDTPNSSDLTNFDFYVVNGAWYGKYNNGFISIFGAPSGDFSSTEKVNILCSNQDRLRGDYNDVFCNFSDINYVAPIIEYKTNFDKWDDDIAF